MVRFGSVRSTRRDAEGAKEHMPRSHAKKNSASHRYLALPIPIRSAFDGFLFPAGEGVAPEANFFPDLEWT